jgi:hypothetical protein
MDMPYARAVSIGRGHRFAAYPRCWADMSEGGGSWRSWFSSVHTMFGVGKGKHSKPMADTPARCSFCNRGQADVRKLIAGPTVMICDDCVSACVDIIVDDARASESAGDLAEAQELRARLDARRLNALGSPVPVPDEAIPLWHARCALCRQIVSTDRAVSIEGRGLLCEDCLAAAQQVRCGPNADDEK